ncbi:hypothetical protein QBC34DRAFT_144262 [Podospora aff. communis PSN243]|uniref:Uncharacterized protein n=1 Tax=Podospora aff. communis PSN243 TaxID=3040156 RepID=A0AAV9GHX6_9PEZI|nr:hypothetical protein QBC34DRAFT_144262 [Podospora aff. communis PSN243]
MRPPPPPPRQRHLPMSPRNKSPMRSTPADLGRFIYRCPLPTGCCGESVPFLAGTATLRQPPFPPTDHGLSAAWTWKRHGRSLDLISKYLSTANWPISKLLHGVLGGNRSRVRLCMTHGICVRRASGVLAVGAHLGFHGRAAHSHTISNWSRDPLDSRKGTICLSLMACQPACLPHRHDAGRTSPRPCSAIATGNSCMWLILIRV